MKNLFTRNVYALLREIEDPNNDIRSRLILYSNVKIKERDSYIDLKDKKIYIAERNHPINNDHKKIEAFTGFAISKKSCKQIINMIQTNSSKLDKLYIKLDDHLKPIQKFEGNPVIDVHVKQPMKEITLSRLKNLTPKKCVELAKYLHPSLNWEYSHDQGGEPWDGHDVIARDTHGGIVGILQVDYREQVNQQWSRVNYFDSGLNKFPVEAYKVKAFLNK